MQSSVTVFGKRCKVMYENSGTSWQHLCRVLPAEQSCFLLHPTVTELCRETASILMSTRWHTVKPQKYSGGESFNQTIPATCLLQKLACSLCLILPIQGQSVVRLGSLQLVHVRIEWSLWERWGKEGIAIFFRRLRTPLLVSVLTPHMNECDTTDRNGCTKSWNNYEEPDGARCRTTAVSADAVQP